MIGRFWSMGRKRDPSSCLLACLPVRLVLAWISTLALTGDAFADGPRQVLILHGDSRLLPSVVLADQGVKARLAAVVPRIDIQTEHLDVSRAPDASYLGHLRDFLQHKYTGRHFDAVIAVGLDAFRFAVEQRATLFPDVPLVFCGVSAGMLQSVATPGDVAGILTQPDVSQTFDAMRALHPGLRRVLVLGGKAEADLAFLAAARRSIGASPGIVVDYANEPTLAAARARIASLPADAAVLFVSMLRDGTNKEISTQEVVSSLREASPVPIYGLGAALIGHGIVGGRVVRFDKDAEAAADLALRLMAGDTSVTGLRVPGPAAFMFDARELRRWNARTSALPPGSVVLFRTPSLWEAYRSQVIGASALIALQAFLIGGLLVQRQRRRRAEQDRRDLAGRLIVAQEDERRRIAHELHDDVQQRLASISLRVSAAKRAAPEAAPALSSLLEDTLRLTSDLRHLSHDLHPPVLEHGGLAVAIRGRLAELHDHEGIAVDLRVGDGWIEPPPAVALGLYRVAQEALQNVSRHAKASTAHVTLATAGTSIAMRIVDDGQGFEAQAVGRHRGIGLASMQERIRMLGGQVVVQSAPGQGTELRVSLPIGGVA
jgi:signal transduction histidine kinase